MLRHRSKHESQLSHCYLVYRVAHLQNAFLKLKNDMVALVTFHCSRNTAIQQKSINRNATSKIKGSTDDQIVRNVIKLTAIFHLPPGEKTI